MPRRRGGAAALVCLAVLGLAMTAGGCGGDDKEAKRRTRSKAPAQPARFSGGALPGTVYLLAGPNPYSDDVYRIRGQLSSSERLTTTAPGLGVSWITAQGPHVVVADARDGGTDQVEALRLTGGPALPGDPIDKYGQAPDLSSTGKVIYTVPQYGPSGSSGGTTVMESDPLGAGKRLVYRSRDDNLGPAAWLPGGHLAALAHSQVNARVLVDPGRPGQHQIDPGTPKAFLMDASSRGSLFVGGRDGRLAVISPGGRPRTMRSEWFPLCWSPDGASILVGRGADVGLMSPQDGSVRTIGRSDGGEVTGCGWVP